MELLRTQLRGKEAAFAEVRARIRPESITVYGGVHHDGEQCGIWLEPEQMAALASCGIGWGVDVLLDADVTSR